jgi:GNAT superfamily N-acetyltransferase
MIDIFHPNFIHKQLIKTTLSEQWNTSPHWVELFLNNLPTTDNVLPKIFLYGNKGFCCIRKDQRKIQLSGLYVLEKYRNTGIANSLIDFSKNYCKNLRIKILYLETVDKEDYYIKRGWETYGERNFPASGNKLKQMRIFL